MARSTYVRVGSLVVPTAPIYNRLDISDAVTVTGGTPYTPPGSWPTDETTGATGTLVTSGTDYFNTSGATYSNMDFTYSAGRIQCVADGVTFNNCRFASEFVLNEVDGATLIDCTFRDGIAISSSRNILILRAKIRDFTTSDAIHITNDGTSFDNEDITIRDCFIYNGLATGEAHSDGMQIRGSRRLHVDHNYVDMGPYNFTHNAAFYAEGLQGGNTDMVIENNYFKTGHGYTLYIHSDGDGGVFRYNTIGPGDYGYQYSASPLTYSDEGNVDWNGNPYDIHNPPPPGTP